MFRTALSALALSTVATAATALPAHAAATSCHAEYAVAGGGTLTADYLIEALPHGAATSSYAKPVYLALTRGEMGQQVEATLTASYFDAAGTLRMSESSVHDLSYSIVKHKFTGSLPPLFIATCAGGSCSSYASYALHVTVDGAELTEEGSGKPFAFELSKAPSFCIGAVSGDD